MAEILEIQSSRLLLRPFLPKDEGAVVRLLMQTDFMMYSPAGTLSTSSAVARFHQLMENYQAYGWSKFAVILRDTQELIGYCGVETCEIGGSRKIELGFRLSNEHRGYGYATEAARVFLRWFDGRYRQPIIAFVHPQNHQSINVLRKLGFQCVGEVVLDNMVAILFNLKRTTC